MIFQYFVLVRGSHLFTILIVLAPREQTSLFISQLLEDFWSANEKNYISVSMMISSRSTSSRRQKTWKELLRFLLHFAFCCRLIIISGEYFWSFASKTFLKKWFIWRICNISVWFSPHASEICWFLGNSILFCIDVLCFFVLHFATGLWIRHLSCARCLSCLERFSVLFHEILFSYDKTQPFCAYNGK